MSKISNFVLIPITGYFLATVVLDIQRQNLRFGNLLGVGMGLFSLVDKTERSDISNLVRLLDFLEAQPKSAGIIENDSDDVVFRNSASLKLMEDWKIQTPGFQTPVNTRPLHNTLSLEHLKKTIADLPNCTSAKCLTSLVINYSLTIPHIGLLSISDQFSRFDFNGRTYRVWLNLYCHPQSTLHPHA